MPKKENTEWCASCIDLFAEYHSRFFSDVFIMALLKALLMWRMQQWHVNLFPSLHPLHRLIRPVFPISKRQCRGSVGVRRILWFLDVSFNLFGNHDIFRVLFTLLILSSSTPWRIESHVKYSTWYTNTIWIQCIILLCKMAVDLFPKCWNILEMYAN